MSYDPQRAAVVFADVLDRPAAERPACLEQACAGDEALRRRVEQLLQAHERAGSFLETPAVGATAALPTGAGLGAPPPRVPQEAAGSRIGPYRLVEQIGEGGMGAVWRAEQEHPVRRQVALKLIKAGMDSAQVVARFEAERQALALMDHPNIARVFDAGATAAGRPYFVMELVPGVPITRYGDLHRLSPRERLELFVPVCQAVQHAHQKGVIHRDLKPSNVLVSVCDGRPVAKVIDFGVAKATEQRLTDQSLFTQLGMVVGTLEYMSPEQAELSAGGVDTRSDVYSLGVLLYELLTGTTPLERDRLREADFTEALRRIREEEPPPPSGRLAGAGPRLAAVAAARGTEPARLVRLVRGELDWIAMRCLEKDRDRRYDSAAALARDVERHLADEPVEAGPPSAGYRLRKLARRHRTALEAAAAFALLLVAAAAVSAWLAVRATWAEQTAGEQRDLAQAAERDARRDRDRARRAEEKAGKERDAARAQQRRADREATVARAVNDFLHNLLIGAAPENNPRAHKVTVEDLLDRASHKIEGRFAGEPLVEASVRQTIGDTYFALGRYRSALPHLERALELRRRELGEDAPLTLVAVSDLARLYLTLHLPTKAEPLLTRSLEAFRRRNGPTHPDTLTVVGNLAAAYRALGKPDRAESLLVRNLQASRRALGNQDGTTLAFLNSLGMLYQAQGKLAEAEALLAECLEGRRRTLGADHPRTLLTMNNLGGIYLDRHKYAQAEALFTEALDRSRRVLGEDHPQTLTTMSNLADLFRAEGKVARAEAMLTDCLRTSRRVLGEDNPDTLNVLNNLGMLYLRGNQPERAEPLLARCLEVCRRALGPQNSLTVAVTKNLAQTYLSLGKYDRAAPLLALFAEVSPGKGRSPAPGGLLASLARDLLAGGENAGAESLLRECLKLHEKKLPDDWTRFEVQSLLGASVLGQGRYAEAEPLLVQGYEGLKARAQSIPPGEKGRLTEALRRVVRLYEAWGKADQVAPWRQELKARTAGR
jgi:serine/threonine protein kinase